MKIDTLFFFICSIHFTKHENTRTDCNKSKQNKRINKIPNSKVNSSNSIGHNQTMTLLTNRTNEMQLLYFRLGTDIYRRK